MVMQTGSSGPLVRSWQQFLVDEGLMSAAELAATEVFDAATTLASQAFQRRVGVDPDGIVGPKTLDAARDAGYAGVAFAARYTLMYGLRTGAFDDWEHPSALVYAPLEFDPSELSVVVYLHGLGNNIENVVQPEAGSAGFPVADLLGHLDRSQRNAILIVPELRHNGNAPDPGRLGQGGALRALLGEIFAKPASAMLGLSVGNIGRLMLISHSGGYRAAAAMALGGGLQVDELCLLDSLYGQEEEFFAFLMATLSDLAAGRKHGRRLVSLYTASGRPAELSRALGRRAEAEAESQGLAGQGQEKMVVVSEEPLDPAAVPREPRVLIQRVAVDHSELPQRFVGQLLKQSGLPPRRG
jgi:hypothetical protein